MEGNNLLICFFQKRILNSNYNFAAMCLQSFDSPVMGTINISTANSNLDGTGSVTAVITGANQGTLLQTITVKAVNSTTQGMVRLFVEASANFFLWREIKIPASSPTGVVKSFHSTLLVNLMLKNGYTLYASTENAESFNISTSGLTWTDCDCPA